jgi:hypothetical protein
LVERPLLDLAYAYTPAKALDFLDGYFSLA